MEKTRSKFKPRTVLQSPLSKEGCIWLVRKTEPVSYTHLFGVKGVGKSSLFETVFSKANCKYYAEEYRYLFVRTILSPNIKGTELTNFLIDRIINGIDLIEDASIRNNLHEQLRTSAEKYNNSCLLYTSRCV